MAFSGLLAGLLAGLALAGTLAAAQADSRGATTPIDPSTPQRLARHSDVQPLLQGFVNPLLPPYGASGDGETDDAAALQAAIDDAYVARMTVVLPAGKKFLLSKQLLFVQPPNVTGRTYGFAMVGGGADSGQARPILKLKDSADTTGWVDMPHNGTYPHGGQGDCVLSQQDCNPRVRGRMRERQIESETECKRER